MTNRQPAGAPTGGQFAAGSQGRADVALDQQDASLDPFDTPVHGSQFGPTVREQLDRHHAKKAQLAAAAAHFERMTAQTIADVIRTEHPDADRLVLWRYDNRWRAGKVLDAEGNHIETRFDDGLRDDTVAVLVDDLDHDPNRSLTVTGGDEGHYLALDQRHGFWDEAVTYGPDAGEH